MSTYGTGLITNPGTLIEDFENSADWTLAGTGAALTADTTQKTSGTQSLKLSGDTGNVIYMTKTVDLDLSADGSFIIDVYSDVYDAERSFGIYFSSTTDFSKQFAAATILLGTRLVSTGHWSHIILSKADFTNTGAESWNNTMIRLKIRTWIGGGATQPFLWLDNLRAGYQAKAVAIISFDDGYASVLSAGKPVLDTNGQYATLFVTKATIGDAPTYLTEAELATVYNAGWDIANHSYSHPVTLVGLDDATLDDEVNDMFAYLYATLGFTRSAKFFCYPEGSYDDTVVTKVAENHRLARTVDDGQYKPHQSGVDDDYFYLGVYSLGAGVAAVEAVIDAVIARNGVIHLYGHQVGAGGVSVADLTTISDYLKANETDISVMTFSEYFDAMGGGEGVLKRWNGAAWVKAKLLNRTSGAAWESRPISRWTGTGWTDVDGLGD